MMTIIAVMVEILEMMMTSPAIKTAMIKSITETEIIETMMTINVMKIGAKAITMATIIMNPMIKNVMKKSIMDIMIGIEKRVQIKTEIVNARRKVINSLKRNTIEKNIMKAMGHCLADARRILILPR